MIGEYCQYITSCGYCSKFDKTCEHYKKHCDRIKLRVDKQNKNIKEVKNE